MHHRVPALAAEVEAERCVPVADKIVSDGSQGGHMHVGQPDTGRAMGEVEDPPHLLTVGVPPHDDIGLMAEPTVVLQLVAQGKELVTGLRDRGGPGLGQKVLVVKDPGAPGCDLQSVDRVCRVEMYSATGGE